MILMTIVFSYAIGTNLCDEDFQIITGDNHCFDIRGKIVSFNKHTESV